jgi:hypothetical protein
MAFATPWARSSLFLAVPRCSSPFQVPEMSWHLPRLNGMYPCQNASDDYECAEKGEIAHVLHARHEAHARTANLCENPRNCSRIQKPTKFPGGVWYPPCGFLHWKPHGGYQTPPGNLVGFLHHPRPAYNSNGPPHIRLCKE